jgi:hypothetical protein
MIIKYQFILEEMLVMLSRCFSHLIEFILHFMKEIIMITDVLFKHYNINL